MTAGFKTCNTADRAAHNWAVEALAQESSLGVEIFAVSEAPGEHVVWVQVWAIALCTAGCTLPSSATVAFLTGTQTAFLIACSLYMQMLYILQYVACM